MTTQQPVRFPFQDAFEYFVIAPWTNWQRFFNPQFFFTYNAEDVDVENNVLREVGSYGKQLGEIFDVLIVLLDRLPEDQLTRDQRRIVTDFRELHDRIHRAVAQVRGSAQQNSTTGTTEVGSVA